MVGRQSASSSSVATSLMDDTSPETAVGKKSESGFVTVLSASWNRNWQWQMGLIWKHSYKNCFFPSLYSKEHAVVVFCLFVYCVTLLFFFHGHQLLLCSCPSPLHLSRRDARHRKGDTQSKRKHLQMSNSFCLLPDRAPGLWWVTFLLLFWDF